MPAAAVGRRVTQLVALAVLPLLADPPWPPALLFFKASGEGTSCPVWLAGCRHCVALLPTI